MFRSELCHLPKVKHNRTFNLSLRDETWYSSFSSWACPTSCIFSKFNTSWRVLSIDFVHPSSFRSLVVFKLFWLMSSCSVRQRFLVWLKESLLPLWRFGKLDGLRGNPSTHGVFFRISRVAWFGRGCCRSSPQVSWIITNGSLLWSRAGVVFLDSVPFWSSELNESASLVSAGLWGLFLPCTSKSQAAK